MRMEDDPDPGSSEKVLMSLGQVVIGGISYRITITVSHILLADMDTGSRKGSIPLQSIGHALSTSNRLREPIIRLTVNDPGSGSQEIDMIFPHIAGGTDIRNRDATLATFKRQGIQVTIDSEQETLPVLSGKESRDRGTGTGDSEIIDRTTVRDWTHFGISYTSGTPLPDEPKPYSPLVTFTAVILLAAICIAAMVLPLPAPKESDVLNISTERNLLSVTPAVTTTPVATMKAPLPEVSVPGKGVYAKISCPTGYSGYISSGGWRMDVNNSGTQVYPLPVQNTAINVFIEKRDSSADILEVGIYNGGISLAHQATDLPKGLVEMHVTVGPAAEAITFSSPASPSETIAVSQPSATPIQYAIPPTGVWVRVLYPGNYSGILSSNGLNREILATGSQIYQMVMKNGTIDGVLEKMDGSSDSLQIEVYKDGTLVDLGNTSAPRGTAEIHTTL